MRFLATLMVPLLLAQACSDDIPQEALGTLERDRVLLKATALHAWPRTDIAALSGEDAT